MTMIDKEAREKRRRLQREGADRLKASGVMDELFAKIDAGEIELDGRDGLIQQMIKTGLERGLQAELTEHLGYERGDAEASLFPNSRNGAFPKTVASNVGDIELAIPRDRDGTFIPRLAPKGSRRLGGLEDMIVSLYAGGMTQRDIEHHLAVTIGTEISRETISKIVDEVSDEVLAWQHRALESWQFPVIVANSEGEGFSDGTLGVEQVGGGGEAALFRACPAGIERFGRVGGSGSVAELRVGVVR